MFRSILLVGLAMFNLSFAQNAETVHSKGQIYVKLKDLISDSQGFWFESSTHPFILGASSIHIDEFGRTYLMEKGVRWICPYPDCGAINDDISNPICQHCGRSNV